MTTMKPVVHTSALPIPIEPLALRVVKRIGLAGFHYLPGLLWLIIALVAVIWLVMSSFKTNQEIFAGVWNPPKSFFLGGYIRALAQANMARYLLNTIMLSIVVVGVLDIIGAMASYVLTRYDFRLARPILLYFIAGMAIPGLLVAVPLYLWMAKLHLLNSLVGLGIVYIAVSLPFSVFVLTGFFRTIPSEIEDAAVVDGASDFAVFWRVAFPLAMPGLVTISIFNFLGVWNEYLLALMLISSPSQMTLPLGLYNLRVQQQMATDWTSLFSGVVITMVPSLIVFLVLQRQLAAGLTTGALKG
jgi:N-acetylglucosamine transport system permease protein